MKGCSLTEPELLVAETEVGQPSQGLHRNLGICILRRQSSAQKHTTSRHPLLRLRIFPLLVPANSAATGLVLDGGGHII
jgi:hypothetical protein